MEQQTLITRKECVWMGVGKRGQGNKTVRKGNHVGSTFKDLLSMYFGARVRAVK